MVDYWNEKRMIFFLLENYNFFFLPQNMKEEKIQKQMYVYMYWYYILIQFFSICFNFE